MAFDVWKVVDPGALQVMHAHVLSTPQREVGGFLVGTHGGPHDAPRIDAAIEAHHARGDLTHLTFTHEAWEHVHGIIDAQYPDSTIIGWYHSHPGHGIFLSGHDQFIQRNFFSAPWQVAIVVDPVAHTEGFFAWARGEITLVSERPVGRTALSPVTPAGRSAFTSRHRAQPAPARRLIVEFDDDEPPSPRVTRPAVPSSPPPMPRERKPAQREPALQQPAPEPSEPRYPVAGLILPAAAGLLAGILLALIT